MNPDRLAPEIRKAVLSLPRIPWHIKSLFPISRLMYNIGARTPLDKGVKVTKEVNDGVEMMIFTPKNAAPQGAILWMFGGGHWAGKPKHLNSISSKVVNELSVAVFVPNYRLAPKHPFPADIDDCFESWNWLVSNAKKCNIPSDKLAIAGHSAGGGIAAALAQRIRDHGGIQPQAQCLFYPMIDDRTAVDHSLDIKNHFVWNNKVNRICWNTYLNPHRAGAKKLPKYAAASRCENLSGLPSAWIGQCELDLFFEEYNIYARRLKEAGISCDIHLVKGVPHAFEVMAPKEEISIQFEAAAIDFLKKSLGIS